MMNTILKDADCLSNSTQTAGDIRSMLKRNDSIDSILKSMHAREHAIKRQQTYISKWKEENDKNSDSQWESYKDDALNNLQFWDLLKERYDELKEYR